MNKNLLFKLSHYRPRVPYMLPMVTAHRIRDLKLHPTAGLVVLFYEDIAPLTLHPEWAQLMQPRKGQILVTAPRGGTLLLDEPVFNRLFIRLETPNAATIHAS